MKENMWDEGTPWKFDVFGDGSMTLSGVPTKDLIDPHPDFLWYSYENGMKAPHSIGTSLFVGPTFPRMAFSPDAPLYCPESVKWNRYLFYAMGNPRLIDSLPTELKSRVMDHVTDRTIEGPQEAPMISGVWSIWGKCTPNGPYRCLDVHECVDIRYEMVMHDHLLVEAHGKSYDDPYFLNDEGGVVMFGKRYEQGTTFSMERRSKAISNWYGLRLRVVAEGLGGQPGDKLLREVVEAQYAWDHKAVYWNRTYFQAVTPRMLEQQLVNQYIMSRR